MSKITLDGDKIIRIKKLLFDEGLIVSYDDYLNIFQKKIDSEITNTFGGDRQSIINYFNNKIIYYLINTISDRLIENVIFSLNKDIIETYSNIDKFIDLCNELGEREYNYTQGEWLDIVQYFQDKYKLNTNEIVLLKTIKEDYERIKQVSKKVNIKYKNINNDNLYYIIFLTLISKKNIYLIVNKETVALTNNTDNLNSSYVFNFTNFLYNEVLENNDLFEEVNNIKNNIKEDKNNIEQLFTDITNIIQVLGKDNLKMKILVKNNEPTYLFSEFETKGDTGTIRKFKDFIGNWGEIFIGSNSGKIKGQKSNKYRK